MSQYVTLELKRGTASEWTTVNPTLAPGEPGFELDTGKLKIGTGTIPWNNLPYATAKTDPLTNSVSLGVDTTGQGSGAVAIGVQSGQTNQGPYSLAIGDEAGSSSQGQNSIALGYQAGRLGQQAYSVSIGSEAGEYTQGGYSTAIGYLAGQTGQLQNSVAIGSYAGQTNQLQNSEAIGCRAGRTDQNISCIAIGEEAGNTNQGSYSVAVGLSSGRNNQGEGSIAIGLNTAYENQGIRSVAIGYASGSNQDDYCIAIGNDTARTDQGAYSIAIGHKAGSGVGYSPQAANSIILNASGDNLTGVSGQTGSFYVSPIRQDLTKTVPLLYDPVTHEIVQGASGIMGPTGPTGTGLLSGITFCGLNFSQGSGGLYTPPFNVDISIPGLTNTSNVQVTAKLTDSGIDYPACSILYAETTTDTLTVYVSSNPNFDGYGLMWNVINF